MVLNREDNVFNPDSLADLENAITKIENTPAGPACMVTVATGEKRFSTGFDLKHFENGGMTPVLMFTRLQKLLPRLITLPMPSMCVIGGHLYAGGVLFALAHDFQTMTANPRPKVCLSEINIDIPLPPAYL